MPNETQQEDPGAKKGITRFFSFLFLELPYQHSHSTRYTITEKCLIHQIGLYISILVGGNILVIDFFLTYIL